MKILLVTLHSQNNNFGSVLQAFSLSQFLIENSYYVETLDYRPYYSNGATNFKAGLKKLLINLVFFPHFIIRKKKFDNIIGRQELSRHYTNSQEIFNDPPVADVYMIGSDQVWNPNYLCGQDDIYYLKFVRKAHKMSYAASMGTSISDIRQLKAIENKIFDFDYISLREQQSVEEFHSIGFKKPEYVLDPVFLHNKAYYQNIEVKPKLKGYILAYIIHKDPFIAEVVKYVRKKTGKKVILIGGFQSKCKYDYYPRTAGPAEFLGYIDNADIIITSSFHGLAFAHIYNKQFLVVLPHGNTLRLTNIMNSAGTSERVIQDISDVDRVMGNNIDFNYVNAHLADRISKSKDYLLGALKSISDGKDL